MRLGATYELEVHALCADEEARRCVPPPEAPSSARAAHERWPRLLQLAERSEAQACAPGQTRCPTLEPGQGGVHPSTSSVLPNPAAPSRSVACRALPCRAVP